VRIRGTHQQHIQTAAQGTEQLGKSPAALGFLSRGEAGFAADHGTIEFGLNTRRAPGARPEEHQRLNRRLCDQRNEPLQAR